MSDQKPVRIFFSAGEPSGDLHGANLIRQLKQLVPEIEIVGYGGPQMAAAGCRLHVDLTALAVMWFLRVLLNIHKFWLLVHRAGKYFRQEKTDAVVLIDYPGLNWWIARKAKRAGIPVFYYTPPQIWAWASWRVKKMWKFVDHVLCSLPFEEPWFRQRGCHATFVGHPFFDEVRRYEMDAEFLKTGGQTFLSDANETGKNACPEGMTGKNACPEDMTGKNACPPVGKLVAILPGSRTQEVLNNLRWFIKAAEMIREKVPDVQFALACFKPHHAELARGSVEVSGLPISIHVGKTPEIMHLADCAMAVSGSVSLELLYHTTPTVVLYWITRPAYFVQKFFRRVKYITLVNLLATGELYPADLTPYDPGHPDAESIPFPEYLTCEDKSAQIAAHVIEWLTCPERRAAKVAQLKALKVQVAHGGASRRAAEYIVNTLRRGNASLPQPHFLEPVIITRK